MKTKELQNKVRELGYELDGIHVMKGKNVVSAISKRNKNYLHIFTVELLSDELFDVLVEYAKTPIEEREEKKYEIAFEEQILAKKDSGEFYFLWNFASTIFQTTFTQSEIDNFPPEIKGAIDCGFLKKVEIEE